MMSDRSDQAEVAVLAPEQAMTPLTAKQIADEVLYLENETSTLPEILIFYDVGQILARESLSASINLASTSRLFRRGLDEGIQGYTARHLQQCITRSDCALTEKIIRSRPQLLFNTVQRSSSNLNIKHIDPIRAAFDAVDIHMLSTIRRLLTNEFPAYLVNFLEEGEATKSNDHLSTLRKAYGDYHTLVLQKGRSAPTKKVLKSAWLAIGKAMRDLPAWLLKEVCRHRGPLNAKFEIDLHQIPEQCIALSLSNRKSQIVTHTEPNQGLGYDYTLLFLFNWAFPKVKTNNTVKAASFCAFDVSDDLKIFEQIYLESKRMIKAMLEEIRQSPAMVKSPSPREG